MTYSTDSETLKHLQAPVLAHYRTRTLSRGDARVWLGHLSFRLVTALLAARVNRLDLSCKDLVNHLYGDYYDGGAEYAEEIVRRMIFKFRHESKLSRLGLRVVSRHGRYAIAEDIA